MRTDLGNRAAMPAPAKRATNLSIDARLLAEAREHGINLSATLEHALVAALKDKARERWLAENKAGLDAYNELVERQPVFSDGLRSF